MNLPVSLTVRFAKSIALTCLFLASASLSCTGVEALDKDSKGKNESKITTQTAAAPGLFAKLRARREFAQQLNDPNHKINVGLSYWIELTRDGKVFRCNNKNKFKSGDQIRFHVVANADGYSYILLKKGSSGGHRLLFPDDETGTNNHVLKGHDYTIPTESALQFDNQKGMEIVGLLFSRTKLKQEDYMNVPTLTCYVSQHQDGAKDLVPTRMQLSWDDPDPVIIPEDMVKPGVAQVVSFSPEADIKLSVNADRHELKEHLKDKSYVYCVSEDPDSILSLEVALQHD